MEAQLDRLLGTFARGHAVREGFATAIVGRPNVGKSSLLNALLGRDRAIVSPYPGTTRDTIEAALDIHGVLLRIIDTAGIRTSHRRHRTGRRAPGPCGQLSVPSYCCVVL